MFRDEIDFKIVFLWKFVCLMVYIVVIFNFIKELNECWWFLQQLVEEWSQFLGSVYEVQRFYRDVDEIKEWIEEKN